ncbi:MAG: hypothetical protein HQL32_09770, partial [Planctomycetes bacterium]|nr:hypothetical protein [Planctomycetota bacterium]
MSETKKHGIQMQHWNPLPAKAENFEEPSGLSRKESLKFMGASSALALGLSGCKRKPVRKIVSATESSEVQKPGKALYYSSTYTEYGVPYGIMVKAVDGRPVKIEGNPEHPLNKGKTTLQMQAGVLSLYDPERLQKPMKGNTEAKWASVDADVAAKLKSSKRTVIVTGVNVGPSAKALLKELSRVAPNLTHVSYDPLQNSEAANLQTKLFGGEGEKVYLPSKAKVVFSVDADLLGSDLRSLEWTRDYAESRGESGDGKLNARWYCAESGMTLTGINADHRLAQKPSNMFSLLRAIRLAIKGQKAALTDY